MIAGYCEVLHNFFRAPSQTASNLLNTHVIAQALARERGVCNNLMQTARKSLILNGEMSEWLSAFAASTVALRAQADKVAATGETSRRSSR